MLKTLVKIAISALLIWWLLGRSDLEQIAARMASADPLGLVLACILLVALAAIQTVRWRQVIRNIGEFVWFKDALANVFIGLFFNQVLPSSIGGDAVRIWRTCRQGLGVVPATHSVMLDRLSALLALVLMAGVSMPWIYAQFGDSPQLWGGVMLVGAGASAFAALFVFDQIPRRLLTFRPLKAVARLSGDARKVMLRPANAGPVLAISVLIHVGVSLSVYIIAQAMGLAVGVVDCLILVPPVILFSMIPVSIAGWGLRESAMVTAFGLAGVGYDEALALSVLFGLAITASGIPGGIVWLLLGSRSGNPSPREAAEAQAAPPDRQIQ